MGKCFNFTIGLVTGDGSSPGIVVWNRAAAIFGDIGKWPGVAVVVW
jgi:hypothetical protein